MNSHTNFEMDFWEKLLNSLFLVKPSKYSGQIRFNYFRNSTEAKLNTALSPLSFCGGSNSTCLIESSGDSKKFGDYQYFMSFGGDQYFDLNKAIDAIFGASGLIIQTGHWLSQVSYEVAGYTTVGNFNLKILVLWPVAERDDFMLKYAATWFYRALIVEAITTDFTP